jgi:hypothetical protein
LQCDPHGERFTQNWPVTPYTLRVVNHTADMARSARLRAAAGALRWRLPHARSNSAPYWVVPRLQAEATVLIDGNQAAKQFLDPGDNEIKGFKDSHGKCVGVRRTKSTQRRTRGARAVRHNGRRTAPRRAASTRAPRVAHCARSAALTRRAVRLRPL